MNELLQKHGCANVFTVPEGLKELMADITREVLREQPEKIFDFIANYLSALLITREHGVMAVKILDDLCDCRPSVSEHLIQLGLERGNAETMAQIINDEIAALEPVHGKEKLREYLIVKKILARVTLDEDMTAHLCQVIRNTYRDYWYRKKMLQENMKMAPSEPWEVAAEHTLELYKRTKPSFDELNRATLKIQAAYRGYHVRRNVLRILKPKAVKKTGPKVGLPGPPLDVAGSREIDLGRIITIKPYENDVGDLFEEEAGKSLGLKYDPKASLTLVDYAEDDDDKPRSIKIGGETAKKKPKFDGFTNKNDEPTVMRTEIKPVFQPGKIIDPADIIEEEISQAADNLKMTQEKMRKKISQERYAPLRLSFANVPEVFIVDDDPIEELLQVAEEPEAEMPSTFLDGDAEIPEDIPDDDYGDDTVPTVSSVNSSDVDDIVSDVGEELC